MITMILSNEKFSTHTNIIDLGRENRCLLELGFKKGLKSQD